MQNPSNRAAHTEQGARNLAFPVPAHQSGAYGDSEDDMPLYRAMLEADDCDLLLPPRKSTSLGEYKTRAYASGQKVQANIRHDRQLSYVSGETVIEADEDGRMSVARMSSMK